MRSFEDCQNCEGVASCRGRKGTRLSIRKSGGRDLTRVNILPNKRLQANKSKQTSPSKQVQANKSKQTSPSKQVQANKSTLSHNHHRTPPSQLSPRPELIYYANHKS